VTALTSKEARHLDTVQAMVTLYLLELLHEFHPRKADAGLLVTLITKFICAILIALAVWPNLIS
jgi:hypothetical protein